jgi:hypothetical protein
MKEWRVCLGIVSQCRTESSVRGRRRSERRFGTADPRIQPAVAPRLQRSVT